MIRIIFILIFLTIPCLAGEQSETLILRQEENGYEGVEDVSLDYQLQGRQEHNFGASPTLVVYCSGGKLLKNQEDEQLRNEHGWVKMAFLRFDLSALPGNAQIESLRLILHVTSAASRNVSHHFELRHLLKNDLIFGSSLDMPENDAVSPAWSKTPSEGWGKGGEFMPRIGEDIESYAFADATLGQDETVLIFENLPLPSDNNWVNGFVLYPVTRSHDGGVQILFASSEHPDISLRPTLEIQYK